MNRASSFAREGLFRRAGELVLETVAQGLPGVNVLLQEVQTILAQRIKGFGRGMLGKTQAAEPFRSTCLCAVEDFQGLDREPVMI